MADVLVVDDDSDLRDVLCGLLEACGHVVRFGRDGVEGLVLVHKRHPDLVVLDVEMPRLMGPDMAYRMFIHDVGEDRIPIVLVSGVVNLSQVADLVGTPYFLSKPYSFETIERVIVRALEEKVAPLPKVARELGTASDGSSRR